MSQSADNADDAVERFHRLVTEGDIRELQNALNKGADVDAAGRVGTTALMLAVRSKDIQKTQLLVRHGADLELTDDFNATALRHAVDADFAEGVRLLLSHGVDRGYHPRYPLKKIDNSGIPLDVEMPAELVGLMSEVEWNASNRETEDLLSEMGENPTPEPVISVVQSVEVLNLFLEAGDDLNLAPTEVKRTLVGLENTGELRVPPREYFQDKTPRFGRSNPELMEVPFWMDMIRTGVNAYVARTTFNDEASLADPVWCYDRFGSTLTPLGDGRFLQIGGEHEDHYDPDFYIYNDVVIHDGKGGFQIYGYPRDVFPPTDFHTATLCRDGIYIIGCLGYIDQRKTGVTPVFQLLLESWKIEPVKTIGEPPGWISEHNATYDPHHNAIRISGGRLHAVDDDGELQLVPNDDKFELDLSRFQWRRLS